MPVALGVNGGILGSNNLPSSGSAKGIWTPNEIARAVGLGFWPLVYARTVTETSSGADAVATGYTIVQTFTATSTWTCPAGVTEVEYLVVAGGGGGGSSGGGGGAGGFRTGTTSVSAGDYVITVGAGGSGGGAGGNRGDGRGLPVLVGHLRDLIGPQTEGAGKPIESGRFAPAGADGVEFGHADVGGFAEVTIGDALALLGLAEDIENAVFEVQGRRASVDGKTASEATGVSRVPAGTGGSSNQERQPDKVGEDDRCQMG